ncbi:tRNA-uridine aminocarboxypropyltransferase [Granulosicoccaceae sp. 1_MG-2023]|nr:tRNA-uridine aminocarboxypropyltransferase [Granulosicoccaceae sp. 1_MG-2023]
MLPDRALNFILLTHSRELAKSSNTGQLLLQAADINAGRIVWSRTEPDETLLAQIAAGGVGLAWPDGADSSAVPVTACQSCILIDGTWQEARKIFNRSAYLQSLPRLQPQVQGPSCYKLRRNQRENGLSTAECAAALLKQAGQPAVAENLLVELQRFQARWRGARA